MVYRYLRQWKADWAGITYIVQGTRCSTGKMYCAIRDIKRGPRKVELAVMRYDAKASMYYGFVMVNGLVPLDYVVTRAEDGSYNVMYGEELVYIMAAESIPGDIKAADFANAIVKVIVADAKVTRWGDCNASK